MSFTYIDDQASQSSGKFTYLDDSSQGKPSMPGKINMTGEGFGDQLGQVVKIANQSVLKTATGQGFEDRMQGNHADTSKMSIPEMLGNNAKEAALGTAGEALDMVTSPLAAIGGIAAGAGKLSEAISAAKNGIAEKALSPEFSQSKSDFNYGHDARRVISSMPDVIGDDANSTQAAVQAKMNETGEAIKSTMQNHPMANTKLDVEDQVTAPFDSKIAELNQQDPYANAAAITRLKQAKIALLNEFDDTGKLTGAKDLTSMTPKEIWEYRKSKIDPMTKFTGNVSDDKVVNSAYQEARQNLKNTMNSVIPELKPLNRDYGDLASADDALDKMQFKSQKEGISGLSIKHIITAGLDNPINRARIAQFLYTAPKSSINSLEEQVPNMAETVKSWFGAEAPQSKFDYNLGMAGKAGSSSPVSAGGAVEAELMGGKGLPSPQKPLIRPDRALPSPQDAGQSSGPTIAGAPPSPTTPDPNGFLAEARNRLANNKGIVNIGDDLKNVSKDELKESLKYYQNLELWHKGQSDASGTRDAQTMINKITNAINDVGRGPLGVTAATGLAAGAALGANKANAYPKANFEDEDAIKTIIGEGESTGFQGMRALASAIRNRGTLQGAYGLNSPRVINHLYSPKTERLARQAWEDSKKRDFSGGSKNWFSTDDLKDPKIKAIIKNMQKVSSYGKGRLVNTFYREGKTK